MPGAGWVPHADAGMPLPPARCPHLVGRVKVLVVGSGAREHALVRSVAADPAVDAVVAAPGNPGIEALARCVPVDPMDGDDVARVAIEHAADLVVIGPEAPLVAGVADVLR